MNNYFIFGKKVEARANAFMNTQTIKDLWGGFCHKSSQLSITDCDEFVFSIGKCEIPILKKEKEFSIIVTENGASVIGKDYGSLMRGFFALLMKIEIDNYIDNEYNFRIPILNEDSEYKIKNRMIHICVFPENDFEYLKLLIRLIGACQYTHVVMEFWGTLEYSCLKELGWPNSLTKEIVTELVAEAKAVGVEPIPMFNHLGHATGSRMVFGKHVVLDQNPKLAYMFTPDGWAWDISSDKVLDLFRTVRKELYEIFGDCQYFHLGCDEAYYYNNSDKLRKALPSFFKKITDEVVKEGKTPIIWMDMLLEEKKFENCYTTGKKGETDIMINSLNKNTVLVDWQYNKALKAPIPSLDSLKHCENKVMGAPWQTEPNYTAHIDTIIQNNYFGIMMTTWHTLSTNMPDILGCAEKCGAKLYTWGKFANLHTKTATLMRAISFVKKEYRDCGWSKNGIMAQ